MTHWPLYSSVIRNLKLKHHQISELHLSWLNQLNKKVDNDVSKLYVSSWSVTVSVSDRNKSIRKYFNAACIWHFQGPNTARQIISAYVTGARRTLVSLSLALSS